MTGRGGRKRWRREWSIWTGGERQKGHGYRWEQGEERLVRNVMRGEGELVCRYKGRGKVCRNKAGLVMHEKRMHRVNEEKGRLKYERCGRGSMRRDRG